MHVYYIRQKSVNVNNVTTEEHQFRRTYIGKLKSPPPRRGKAPIFCLRSNFKKLFWKLKSQSRSYCELFFWKKNPNWNNDPLMLWPYKVVFMICHPYNCCCFFFFTSWIESMTRYMDMCVIDIATKQTHEQFRHGSLRGLRIPTHGRTDGWMQRNGWIDGWKKRRVNICNKERLQ